MFCLDNILPEYFFDLLQYESRKMQIFIVKLYLENICQRCVIVLIAQRHT